MKVDIFFRKENKNFKPDNIFGKDILIDTKLTDKGRSYEDLQAILDYIYSNGLHGTGTHRSGIFEVQTDHGIWYQKFEKKIDLSTERKRNLTTFLTWEEYDIALENEYSMQD